VCPRATVENSFHAEHRLDLNEFSRVQDFVHKATTVDGHLGEGHTYLGNSLNFSLASPGNCCWCMITNHILGPATAWQIESQQSFWDRCLHAELCAKYRMASALAGLTFKLSSGVRLSTPRCKPTQFSKNRNKRQSNFTVLQLTCRMTALLRLAAANFSIVWRKGAADSFPADRHRTTVASKHMKRADKTRSRPKFAVTLT